MGASFSFFNTKVNESKYYRIFRKHSLSQTGEPIPLDQQYSRYKDMELMPFLYEVPSQIIRNGLQIYAGTYQVPQRYWWPHLSQAEARQADGDVTSELFRFESIEGKPDANRVFLGKGKFPAAELK